MTKQKKGFWVFFFSLIPGAGELYMGFKKMGLSTMILFWGCIACAALLEIPALIFVLPIIWFYSFFNVHNLKCLTEEEFCSVEDHFLFPTDELVSSRENFVRQYRNTLAALLIIFGICGLWNNLISLLQQLLPDSMFYILSDLTWRIPQLAISLILIVIGIRLVKGKKEQLEYDEQKEEKDAKEEGAKDENA